MMTLEETTKKIAEQMGLDVTVTGAWPNYQLDIRHQASEARIVLPEDKGRELLHFLDTIRLVTNISLEERVRKLEEAVFSQPANPESTGYSAHFG